MAKQFTLGKNERLKSRKEIERVFSAGKTLAVSPFLIYYLVREPDSKSQSVPTLQFGVGVSSKIFKRAVDRNRIRRLVRESYRVQKHALSKTVNANNLRLHVFFIYVAKELPGYKLIYDAVGLGLQKLSSRIGKQSGK